jgi:hypothetical protein
LQRSPDVEFTEGSSVVLTGEDLTQLGDSFSAKFYRDGTLVETYSGNVGPDGSLPLGLVKLKQGTYSVELASGGTTLTPFKAVVKPSTASTMADNLESDTTFQKLPQSGTEQIETTGNAALPEQIKLVTEDSKSNAGKEIDTATDLPKSENRSLESQRSFLTADQVNGLKAVFDNKSAPDNANTTQTKAAGQESPRVRSLAESNLEFSDASGNQPLSDTKDSFSSNQNFINNNLENKQDISSNNALPNSQETISKNAELPSSVSFGLSQDGSPISQNAPLGYTPDGVPISQSFDLDKNGLPITQNRPFDGSPEAFSINTPLEDGESQSVVQNENIQFGNSIGPNAEYQRLPEAILANELGQSENSPSGNAAFESFDQQSTAPDKLQGSNFPGGSKNNNFIETDGEIYSENQKLTDSTIFNSRTDVEGANQNQPGEYQQIPEANLNYNSDSNSSGAVSEQYNKAGIEQTQASDQIPDKINQAVGQNNQVVTQASDQIPDKINQAVGQNNQTVIQGESTGATYQSVGPEGLTTTQGTDRAVGQADTNEVSGQPASLVSTPDDDLINILGQNISDTNIYQTRTIGATGGSLAENAPGRESDGIYSGEAAGSGELDNIVPSRILSSSIVQQAPNPQYSNNEVVQAEQQNRQSDYVQVGNTYSTGNLTGMSQINNFNLDTDLPGDFYEYKGSRNISNEELLDEFLNSEEFKKLDEESKSRVINVKQEIQAQKTVPTQNQQDSVLSGTVLSGGQPIKDKTREPTGFAKLFTRNKQDRPVDRTQEQIQRQFEESNSLKQKVSLTLNKVFGSNEKSASISEYTTPDQQVEQLQNSQFEDTDEDILQSDDYQFGDEDNVINRYPRITGARETLDEDYQEELRKRRKKRRNLRYLPVGANLESKFLQASNEQVVDSLPSDEESNIYRGLIGERDRFQNLTISEQEQNKIALRKAEHDIQQQLNKALEENVIIKENAENQAAELSADSETMFYKELVKERERFQQALSEERDQNKAALRRSEEQIQRQLIDVLTSNPQTSPAQASNDPISQVVRSLVDSGKDKEEVIIDATRIIQMIQNNQTVAGAQEIDEFLLRQRIERELKYEFKQMQLEHEQKMKLIYRRMIEDMYIDMLNS